MGGRRITIILVTIVLFPLVVISSCSQKISIVETTTQTSPPSITSTINTPLSPTGIINSATPTVAPEPFITNCVRRLDAIPDLSDVKGKLVVEEQGVGVYVYDVGTQSRLFLDGYPDTFWVSPDHLMIAFLNDSAKSLIVSDRNGNIIKNIPTNPTYPEQDLYPAQWLDNQHVLTFAPGVGAYPNYHAPYAVIFNIESGGTEKITMDFPGLTFNRDQQGENWYYGVWFGDARLSISSDQKYYLYPAIDGPYGYLVVWNVESGSEIYRFPGIMPWNTVPRWSPIKEQFATMAIEEDEISRERNQEISGDEIFLLDPLGNHEKITSFDTESPGNVSYLSWSPDGQRIAFWMDSYDAENRHYLGGSLFVVDLGTEMVVNYCIEGQGEIFWSLDGNYLIVNTYSDPTRPYENAIALINLTTSWFSIFMDRAHILGIVE